MPAHYEKELVVLLLKALEFSEFEAKDQQDQPTWLTDQIVVVAVSIAVDHLGGSSKRSVLGYSIAVAVVAVVA